MGWDLWQVDLFEEKAMAPHSSTPAWKIPWKEEPDRLQSMGSSLEILLVATGSNDFKHTTKSDQYLGVSKSRLNILMVEYKHTYNSYVCFAQILNLVKAHTLPPLSV